jgi:Protein of unknown function (DUF2612)
MTMKPPNGSILQAMKWMQNKAPNIQSLVQHKSDWYAQFHTSFWNNWKVNIFDIRTANPFGIMVWCTILGVPSSIFGLYASGDTSWAYGKFRQNYVYSGTDLLLPDPNNVGGNFFGGSNTTILNIQEARWILMLRYAALSSNGKISLINKMLRWIFNDDQPWDFPGKNYFYVIDNTAPDIQTLVPTAPIVAPMVMEYRIGANFPVSVQFISTIRLPQYGIMPTAAGVRYDVIQEP